MDVEPSTLVIVPRLGQYVASSNRTTAKRAVAGEGDVLRLTEGSTESLGCAPVVEIVRRQIDLRLCPFNALDRAVDTDSHNSRDCTQSPAPVFANVPRRLWPPYLGSTDQTDNTEPRDGRGLPRA